MLRSDFRPHPLLRGAHLQTMASLLRPAPKLVLRCERLELPDGDFVDLGWRTVIFQLRGAGPEPNRLQRCYNQGDTDDLRYFWHLLRNREPHAFIATVGWSLGGNVTLKALAEEGNAAPVDIAAAASVPFIIRPCAERLRSGFSRLYQKLLLDALKDALRRKHRHIAPSPLVNLAAALVARDFIEYDEAYTAPLAGYRDAEDYYTHSSCGRFLRNIRRPTLVVHALNDPFMTTDIVPALEALAPCVTLEVAQSGGHVGFVSAGALGLPYCWLERRLTAYLHDGYERRVGALVHPVDIRSAERSRGLSDLYPVPAGTFGLALATTPT